MTVTEVTDASSAEFAALAEVWAAGEAEINPGDAPFPAQDLAGQLFADPPHYRHRAWLATRDGEPVGGATVGQELDGVNDDQIELYVVVPPLHRRAGVAWALTAPALDAAQALGGRLVIGAAPTAAGGAFCRALGLTPSQDERCSRLVLADLDEAQQRAWIDEAPAWAAGYRLAGWVGVVPDAWAAAVATALDAMIDAPVDDLDWRPQPVSGARHQSDERWWDARGYDIVTTLALAPDGSPAGVTQLLVSRLRPELGEQGDTGVLAAHRGHALGRWLKAANLCRAREHQPGLAVVETYNAESNPWMLAINVAMGFRPHVTYRFFQGPLDDARDALGRWAAAHRLPASSGSTSTRMTTTQGHLASGAGPGWS